MDDVCMGARLRGAMNAGPSLIRARGSTIWPVRVAGDPGATGCRQNDTVEIAVQ
jgi:hypothetical protein